MQYILNADNRVFGRIASRAAHLALEGHTIHVIHCEKSVLTGSPARAIENLQNHINLTVKGNPLRSPKYSKMPDQILRIAIRGMLPKKSKRGRNALARVHVHIGVPAKLKDATVTPLDGAKPNPNAKQMTLLELAHNVGAHI